MKKFLLLAASAAVGLISLIGILQYLKLVHFPTLLLSALSWLLLLLFVTYAAAKRSLTTWILVSMLAGALLGYQFPTAAANLHVLSAVFLKLVKTIIAPLIFSTLVMGIGAHTDLRKVGLLGLRTLIYFTVVSTLALIIGAAAINISRAGAGITPTTVAQVDTLPDVKPVKGADLILNAVPENIAKSVVENQMLQIVIFSVLFGISLALLPDSKRLPMLAWIESLAEVMFKFTNLVMYLAPLGVAAAIAYTVGHLGPAVLLTLLKLVATLYVALIVFVVGVLLPIALVVGVNLKRFVAYIAEPVSIAFATSSSDAALPRALTQMEEYGVPRRTVSFVLPTGYTFNLAGTTLYLGLASIFVAQVAGIPLTFERQLLMLLTLMLTSKGVAAVPRTSLLVLIGTATTFGLPVEPIFLIIGIDQLMDMARTAVNTIGNCLAAVAIARWEGELIGEAKFPTPPVPSAPSVNIAIGSSS